MTTSDPSDDRREPIVPNAATGGHDRVPDWDHVVLPSPFVVASVRIADPPTFAPDSLAPFVLPDERDGELVDWLITEDAIAFGDPSLPYAFTEWRATWEQAWELERLSSLARLDALGRNAGDGDGPWFSLIGALLAGEGERRIGVPEQAELAAECEVLRDLVRERGATGYGVVDATPGRITSGMAVTWSAYGGAEVVARHALLEVRMEPDLGLCLAIRAGDGVERLTGVSGVEVDGAGSVVTSSEGGRRLDVDEATALAWLMPNSTRWRVRTVPEALVWARTFAGLPECCDVATRYEADVLVRVTPPIALISNDERTS
jgi:hypothetical protein